MANTALDAAVADKARPSEQDALRFFRLLYGDATPGFLTIWTPDKVTRPFAADKLGDAARAVAQLAQTQNVYYGVGLQATAPTGGSRGKAADVIAIPGLWADLDIGADGHKKAGIPTQAAALDLLAADDVPLPTVIVDTGHGLHAYWLFKTPWVFQNAEERGAAAALVERYQAILRTKAEAHGWTMDSTHDLARLLRPAGTVNRKGAPLPVKVYMVDDAQRYEPGDFMQYEVKAIVHMGGQDYHLDGTPLAPAPAPPAPNGNGRLHAPTPNPAEFWLNKALEWTPTKDGRNAAGFDLACQLRDAEVSQSEAEAILRRYQAQVENQGDHPYTEAEAQASVTQAYSRAARGAAKSQRTVAPVTKGPAPAPSAEIPVSLIWDCYQAEESGDADLLAHLYADKLVYDHTEGAWYVFNGHTWHRDDHDDVTGFVTGTVASQYLTLAAAYTQDSAALEGDLKKQKLAQADSLTKRAKQLRNVVRVRHILELARRSLAFRGEWDADPDLLGVANGVIDLRTGEHRAGRPGDYIRTFAPTEWAGLDTPAPRWEAFIREVMSEDGDGQAETPMSEFVQRLLGYGTTGHVSERKIAFFYGEGANGKDTLLEAVAGTLGPLAGVVKADILIERRPTGHDTPMMDLIGRRLVWVNETSEGDKLNSAQVKNITGGGRIIARGAYDRRTSTWAPTHFVILMTNNLPSAPPTDTAFWDRVLPVPFKRRFIEPDAIKDRAKERPKDTQLRGKLEAERPGILAWLVRGALAWRRQGLQPPGAVGEARKKYREDVDDFGRFLAETYIEAPDGRLSADDLLAAWQSWSGKETNKIALGRWMTKRNYTRTNNGGVYYMGLVKKTG